LALGMAACLHWGVHSPLPPPARINRDVFGLASCGIGFALIYAALDQGNRLDWQNSGVIWGLALAGIALLAAFALHEGNTRFPWLDSHVIFRWPMPGLVVMVGILRLSLLATAYLVPQYLGGVRGFRALQIGDTLLWIAAPQLLICPVAALMLRRSDPRITASFGLCLIGVACMTVAYSMTSQWGSDQFLLSQLLQAVGQSFALSGIVFNAVLNLRPQDALTFGAMLQIGRLFGGEVGSAFMATLTRLREQHASNLIGQHVRVGDADVQYRLQVYGHVVARGGHPAAAAPALLGGVVRSAATTQSVIDGFVGVAAVTVVGMLLLVLLPAPPRGPASHMPLFRRGQAT